jgi:hypothetical protein
MLAAISDSQFLIHPLHLNPLNPFSFARVGMLGAAGRSIPFTHRFAEGR